MQNKRKDPETRFVVDFVGSRTLKIGHLVGQGVVRAFCLSFEDVLIKWRRVVCNGTEHVDEMIEEKDRLLAPVFAVNEMGKTG